MEFAVAAPIIVLAIVGFMQVGLYYAASAGMKNALDEGVRLATIYPRPTDTTIQNQITAKAFGLNTNNLTLTLTHGTSNGGATLTIAASYTVASVGMGLPSLTISDSRIAFQN
ncbi:MAG: pilus assembly protein [Novosphingobium sp.]|nr:pilus assembly protein [Novosphingobium sp.]